MKKLGVAILNTDRPDCLNRLLKSIDRYTKNKPEIFIVWAKVIIKT